MKVQVKNIHLEHFEDGLTDAPNHFKGDQGLVGTTWNSSIKVNAHKSTADRAQLKTRCYVFF